MRPGETARAWTDVFRRQSRVPDVPAIARRPGEVTIASRVFPRFLAVLTSKDAPTILDLGPVVGANVAFFGERLAGKIHVEDLFADIEAHAQRGARGALAGFLASRLKQEPETVDGILCWDVFDYLDRSAGQALATRLVQVLRPGGVLIGSFGTTPVQLTHYTRTALITGDRLSQRTYPAAPVQRTVWVTRDIGKLFVGLSVAESVLLKSNTRETLFRKP